MQAVPGMDFSSAVSSIAAMTGLSRPKAERRLSAKLTNIAAEVDLLGAYEYEHFPPSETLIRSMAALVVAETFADEIDREMASEMEQAVSHRRASIVVDFPGIQRIKVSTQVLYTVFARYPLLADLAAASLPDIDGSEKLDRAVTATLRPMLEEGMNFRCAIYTWLNEATPLRLPH